MTTVTDRLDALEASAEHLASHVQRLTPEQLTSQAYPTNWTIADVLSHLGSGAVIMLRGIDAAMSGDAVEDGFNQSVWDVWNAKDSAAKASDALAADRALLDRVVAFSDDERAAFRFQMGSLALDLASFLALRLNEHVLHTWDVDVAIDPTTTLPGYGVGIVIDNLEMITRFGGKSDGNAREITIRTTEPARSFRLRVGADRVSLAPESNSAVADVELPSEAFVRLVYGRLDPAHNPAGADSPRLDELRRIFPGV